ncbi:MAG: DegT/DnrJ/EryC1/StrS aminotransferase family protein [Nitrospirae bacterium]|nr:DegT/DnrJ/EryC1/StrS aminotransferase family protein [Nitrospirota bacterium]
MPLQELVRQIYLPPPGHGALRLGDFFGNNNIRFFSYGRHALLEGLKIAGVAPGERVLIPGFICRDLLSAVNSLGAKVEYYPVDRLLQLSVSPDAMPDSKVILAVNYFGFPQDLRPFRDYCKKTGAVLIEDNAHGLFSRDENSSFLGTRGDFGIFSLRKTIPMPNGAALILNNLNAGYNLEPQIAFSPSVEPLSFRLKQLLRKIAPFIGVSLLQFVISLNRHMRRLRTGYEIMPSASDAEYILPEGPSPSSELFSYLSSVDVSKEIKRRRELYIALEPILKEAGAQPVFKSLPAGVAPYAYPFYASDEQTGSINKLLRKYGLECFRWPELPDAVKSSAPEHYKTIWFVSFLW